MIQTKQHALHLSWSAFFLTFFAWFAFAPFATTIGRDIGLTAEQLAWVMLANLGLTIPARVVIGGLTDRWGVRFTFGAVLVFGATATAMTATATTYTTLLVSRLAASVLGAGFVVGIRMIREWWPARQIGMAEGFYAGWGNFGSAAAALSLPILAGAVGGWRSALAVLSIMLLLGGVTFMVMAVDTPESRSCRRPRGATLGTLLRNRQIQVIAVAYFVTFGGELAVISMLPAYMEGRFHLSVLQAASCASVFAATNLFARPLGGMLGDRYGRVVTMQLLLFGVAFGYLLIAVVLPRAPLAAALYGVILCACFVQTAEGAAFSIAPFARPECAGQIAGIIGAAGNLGGLVWIALLGVTSPEIFFLALCVAACIAAPLCSVFLEEPDPQGLVIDEGSIRQWLDEKPRGTL